MKIETIMNDLFIVYRSWLLRYHHIQTNKSFALPVLAFVFTKITVKNPVCCCFNRRILDE